MNRLASRVRPGLLAWPSTPRRLNVLVLPAGLALLGAVAPLQAQGLPAASTSFVQLQLTSCGTTLLRGQGTLDDECSFGSTPGSQGASGANGSNLGGILRGNTSAGVAGVNLIAESRINWDDRFTYLGGAVPASVVLRFQLSGIFNAAVSGPSTAAIGEVDFRAVVQPFGSWGSSGSFASGSLNERQLLQTAGAQLSDFRPVLASLALPVSLGGIAVGNSLDLSTSFLLRSQASAGRGGVADASANFSNSAGLVGLQFFDALGADITPDVQGSWQYGTQLLTPVPETSTLWLALAGLTGLLARRRAVLARGEAAAGCPTPPGPGLQAAARAARPTCA